MFFFRRKGFLCDHYCLLRVFVLETKTQEKCCCPCLNEKGEHRTHSASLSKLRHTRFLTADCSSLPNHKIRVVDAWQLLINGARVICSCLGGVCLSNYHLRQPSAIIRISPARSVRTTRFRCILKYKCSNCWVFSLPTWRRVSKRWRPVRFPFRLFSSPLPERMQRPMARSIVHHVQLDTPI